MMQIVRGWLQGLRAADGPLVIVAFGATALLMRAVAGLAGRRVVVIDSIECATITLFRGLMHDEAAFFMIASISGNTAEAVFYARMLAEHDALLHTLPRTVAVCDKAGALATIIDDCIGIGSTKRTSALNNASRLIAEVGGCDMLPYEEALGEYTSSDETLPIHGHCCIVTPQCLLPTFRWLRHLWEENLRSGLIVMTESELLHGRVEYLLTLADCFCLIVTIDREPSAAPYAKQRALLQEILSDHPSREIILHKDRYLTQALALCDHYLSGVGLFNNNVTLRCKTYMQNIFS
jgi:hypothetical protein